MHKLAVLLALAGCSSSPATPVDALIDTPPDVEVDAGIDAQPLTRTIDCALATGACSLITIANDPPAAGKFHGYADPSMRTDPTTGTLFMAYSWPRFLADGTINVELHLAHSTDHGGAWLADGPLFQAKTVNNPGGAAYAASNHSSDEVIDVLPVPVMGGALWVQAHMVYLVPTGTADPYSQIDTTSYISITTAFAGPHDPPSTLLALGTNPEARLGAKTTDATLGATNLSAIDSDNCTNFNQPALFFANNALYLVLECYEHPASGDGKATAHFVFRTHVTGTDPRTWQWEYRGLFATPADASRLGTAEGTTYSLFTEPQLMLDKHGQLLVLMNPTVPVSGGIQPAVQYGCRAIPMLSLDPPMLETDASGAPKVVASVISSDLYTGANEGTGACTYDPDSSTGIVLVRKLEADPTLGFDVDLRASRISP